MCVNELNICLFLSVNKIQYIELVSGAYECFFVIM